MEDLDNPVWHALTGRQAGFSEGDGPAVRFHADVSVFAALPDEVDRHAWAALAQLTGPGGTAVLFRPAPLAVPSAWEVTGRMGSLQMVATEPIGQPDDAFVTLGPPDAEAMLDLVERTRPGPFAARTVELGTYLGRRRGRGHRLDAMAGVRLHVSGHREISAVCTDVSARKQGLATRLVRAVAAGIESSGETPILHVHSENHAAIRVYEKLGFATRVAFDALIVRAPR